MICVECYGMWEEEWDVLTVKICGRRGGMC